MLVTFAYFCGIFGVGCGHSQPDVPRCGFAPGLALVAWTGSCGVYGAGPGILQADVPQGSGFVSGPAAWSVFCDQPLGNPLMAAVLPFWCSVGSHSQPLQLVPGSSGRASGDGCGNPGPEIVLECGFVSESAHPVWTCSCQLPGKPLRTVMPSAWMMLWGICQHGCSHGNLGDDYGCLHPFGLSRAGWTGCRSQAPGNCEQALLLPGWQCWSCCSQELWSRGMAAVHAG